MPIFHQTASPPSGIEIMDGGCCPPVRWRCYCYESWFDPMEEEALRFTDKGKLSVEVELINRKLGAQSVGFTQDMAITNNTSKYKVESSVEHQLDTTNRNREAKSTDIHQEMIVHSNKRKCRDESTSGYQLAITSTDEGEASDFVQNITVKSTTSNCEDESSVEHQLDVTNIYQQVESVGHRFSIINGNQEEESIGFAQELTVTNKRKSKDDPSVGDQLGLSAEAINFLESNGDLTMTKAKSKLIEICAANSWKPPSFILSTQGTIHQKRFICKITIEVDTFTTTMLECFSEAKLQKEAAEGQAGEGALWFLKHLGHA